MNMAEKRARMGQIAHWHDAASMLERPPTTSRTTGGNNDGTTATGHGFAAAAFRPRLKPARSVMDFPVELLINAIIAGVLLGGFYVAVTVGVSISFGMLDIVNIAHPAFIILGSYLAYILNSRMDVDPVLAGLLMLPVFYALGASIYQVYYVSFEMRGREALSGLAFFFGILFIHRGRPDPGPSASTTATSRRHTSADAALRVRRSALPPAGALRARAHDAGRAAALSVAHLRRARHHGGVAGPGRARADGRRPDQDQTHRVGISIATAALAGAFLIIIQPVEPSVGREYIGACSRSACSAGSAACPAP
jgi:branched-chain amino acid transport system permease protein